MLDTPNGIVFDPNPQINLTLITKIIFIESILIFFYRLYHEKEPLNFELGIKFIGFASSVPWISTLVSETIMLTRWYIEGTFSVKTSGMAIGGAGNNDVLFNYGLWNLGLSIISVIVIHKWFQARVLPRVMISINKDQYEEGIKKVYKNAVNFLESSEILAQTGKGAAATALAIHAFEELGKASKLLDEIDRDTDKISEDRWSESYCEHKPKLRAANIDFQKEAGYKGLVWNGTNWKKKGEGDVAKEFTDFDLERKERRYYVDYDFKGGKGWVSPLERDTMVTPDDWIAKVKVLRNAIERKCTERKISV